MTAWATASRGRSGGSAARAGTGRSPGPSGRGRTASRPARHGEEGQGRHAPQGARGPPGQEARQVELLRRRDRRQAGEDFRLARDFSAEGPGELLVTDVTEFGLPAGKVYASPVLVCWDGCPVGLSVSSSPGQELCSSSLAAALSIEPGDARPVVHTDGGSCYRSARWKAQCEAAGAVRSMSRRGTCPDNAGAEGFFGTLKQEFFYGKTWVGSSVGEFASELVRYVDWYVSGRPRRFETDGRATYMTLAEHRRREGVPVPVIAG